MKLGERIKLLRIEKELTQPELAHKAGIEQSYLSKLENEKAIPSFDIINRIAMAMESSGLEVIDTLNQSYVEENLSHIPEVAAEYAVIKKKRESVLKKRFIFASLLVIFGIGIGLTGQFNLLFPELAYKYESKGIIKEGEIDNHFSHRRLKELNENVNEQKLRMDANRERIKQIYKTLYTSHGTGFIENVNGGRRLYQRVEYVRSNKIQNDFILIVGVMFVFSGFFVFLFSIRFKPN